MIEDEESPPTGVGGVAAGGTRSAGGPGNRIRATRPGPGAGGEPPAPNLAPAPTVVSPGHAVALDPSAGPARAAHRPHLLDVVDLGAARGAAGVAAIAEQPILIVIESLRADAKASIFLREDQRAAWSEGNVSGLVGFSLSTTKDPTIYMRSFLINSREMYLQSYSLCREIRCQLYVRTRQREVRGRVNLPPGASVSFETSVDRTTVVGVSSFVIEFPPAG
jgi:hypothetical protein